MKKFSRDFNNKKISGICAGVGNYFNIDPTVIRVVFILISCYTTFISLILYIILTFVIPYTYDEKEHIIHKKLYRNTDKNVSGVCYAIGVYLGIDPTIIRVLFVIFSIINPFFIIGYFLSASVIPFDNNIID